MNYNWWQEESWDIKKRKKERNIDTVMKETD